MDSNILAYVAGLFDGEGCVTISSSISPRNGTHYYVLYVMVYNTNMDIILQLKDWFGGFIITNDRKGSGHKDCYCWRVAANKAYEFLELIISYVRIKNKQVRLAMTFKELQDSCGHVGKSHPRSIEDNELLEMLYQRIKVLNRRGE